MLIAWVASIPVALHAETGTIASAGFLALGAAWIATTAVSVVLILRRRLALHRSWMIRSYALTASAITLRIYLGLGAALAIPFVGSRPAIAWLCWVSTYCSPRLSCCTATGNKRQQPDSQRDLAHSPKLKQTV